MSALRLLLCVGLSVFSAHAKVVTDFQECSTFFYNGTEPAGMDQNSTKICQKLTDSSGYYYATLYSVPHRIPLYSAYTMTAYCKAVSGASDDWHIEPQISQLQPSTAHMVSEKDKTPDELNIIKESQAISKDYEDSGYERGHLNPNSLQCDADRRATTFTLTNAAPVDSGFYGNHWKNWESTLRTLLVNKFIVDADAVAYIITGTVPSRNPQTAHREITGARARVTVPSHFWTAVCYKHNSNNEESFSFGYLGTNSPEGDISLMSVSALNNQLSELYSKPSRASHRIQIFTDDCFNDNNKLSRVQGKFPKIVSQELNQEKISSSIDTMLSSVLKRSVSGDSSPSNTARMSKVTVKLSFDSLRSFSTVTDALKTLAGTACLITHAKPFLAVPACDEGYRVTQASDEVECVLVSDEQKTAADGSTCHDAYSSEVGCVCKTADRKSKSCCSTPCMHNPRLRDYRCYSGYELIKCSPRYSLITAKGDQCKVDHSCGKYGEDYYWCNKASGGWDYCSPPLWSSKAENGQYCRSDRACATYGEIQPWCYTDDTGEKHKCCTSDDCDSAVNGKTCRKDHRCDYHGEKYLWCYTDDQDSWEHCCTRCGA